MSGMIVLMRCCFFSIGTKMEVLNSGILGNVSC